MFKKSIALTVPALAAGALVAASLSGGAVQANSAPDHNKAPTPKAAKAVSVKGCNGGVQKRSADRGLSGYIYTYSTTGTPVVGSKVRLRGPARGKDTLSVNFSAGAYAGTTTGHVKVLLDGVPMAPSDAVEGSQIWGLNDWHDFSRNYCGRIGRGWHTLRVSYSTEAGGIIYLLDPMLHAEQSE